ncbi:formylglycine-generating enzyme family protein [bacterium]|nr:formylglycine-generating enzyme family protein [bacterium]
MQAAFNRAMQYDENDLMEAAEKLEVWRSFLKAFPESNPYSKDDDQLRRQAEERLEHWQVPESFKVVQGSKPGEERTFDGIKFVWIPPGEFWMGSPKSEKKRFNNEGPLHTVRIAKGFWLGKFEVTQAEYERVMGKNPSHFKGSSHPVESLSWNDAVEFCGKLSGQSGAIYRLPTEAEWEYACRAGTTTRFNTGDSDSELGRAGWYAGNSRRKTHDVGQKAPNAWGLFDMHGNVWEWCSDWYGEDYYGSSPGVDPTGPGSGSRRVIRGGSWYNLARYCRSAARYRYDPRYRYFNIGLRVARSSN